MAGEVCCSVDARVGEAPCDFRQTHYHYLRALSAVKHPFVLSCALL